ncbi:MAG: hypothetical protein QOF02_624 [Blastocatellia bacterium]|jgi:gamma-glutamylcyclotransferase (GGCT)/AIG2-like uncharacterized protein YtfP|nr:hypothetical protein [Blastocatellia bacterium]
MDKHLVFVYGTLRQGGVRALSHLFPGAKFIGQAKVSGSLYDLGPHPGLRLDEASPPVIGEVYEIDDKILRKLDEIEESSAYTRKQVEVSQGNDKMLCWIYSPASELSHRRRLIASGDWIEYAKTKTEWPADVWPDETES